MLRLKLGWEYIVYNISLSSKKANFSKKDGQNILLTVETELRTWLECTWFIGKDPEIFERILELF